jgi:hypothetical protein
VGSSVTVLIHWVDHFFELDLSRFQAPSTQHISLGEPVGWVELAKPNAINANIAGVGFRASTQPTDSTFGYWFLSQRFT